MAQKTNSFERFWKELKRRKVVHVITVYAATAFVIIELVSMVTRPLKLPDWTEAFVIILLCIGFIIAVFVSWVYDITPAGVKKTKPVSELKHVDHMTHEVSSGWKIATYISGAIIVALLVFNFINRRNLNVGISKLDKSIAVLPFRNLSNDSTQLYFCDGFMEEVLNDLQKIKEFTVRSRTSTDQYRKTTKTIKTIGEELNVNYLIEGSVGREENNLKIWVQLINAKTDEHIWANDYTREFKQIFSLQNEIAKEIASELKTVLSPEEKKQIDKKLTENLEAYNYYLIGNEYYWRSYENQDYTIAASMYTRAIELDPNFAQAYIRLALCHLSIFWFHYDHSMERISKSKDAIDAASNIDPDLLDIHLALGYYYYWGFLDYSKALEEFKIAETKMQNNPECIYGIASVYRRAGEWSLAKNNFVKASELDPGSSRVSYNTAETLYLLGEYSEAEKYFEKTTLLNPTFVNSYWLKGLMYMKWQGNTIKARETIKESYKVKEASSNPLIFETNALTDLYDRNYQKALSFLSTKDIEIIENQFYFNLKSLLLASIYKLFGNTELAYTYYDSSRIDLETRIFESPDDSRLYSAVGIAYAGLGLKNKAIEAGEKAVELMPVNKEAYRGTYRVADLAKIYVMLGEYEAALKQIEYLLSVPSPLSVNLLLLDPTWKPLWNLPEFKKITNIAPPDD